MLLPGWAGLLLGSFLASSTRSGPTDNTYRQPLPPSSGLTKEKHMTTRETQDRIAPDDEAVWQPDKGPRIRASDADRSVTVDLLQGAVARGLLTHEEGGERIANAF